LYFQLAELSQTSVKVKNMFEIVFDPSQPLEKREKGADNLVSMSLKIFFFLVIGAPEK
jgi:hypothetical protein